MKHPVRSLLEKEMPHIKDESDYEDELEELKQELAHLQQVAWVNGKRAVIVMEGFDAAGKGTCIRHLTELLDPRSATVIPIGTPTEEQLGQHYLQRFWQHLPNKGQIAIFDRSWYGRVLVEKVEKLTNKPRLEQAYSEINTFEKMLTDDGIIVIKIFLVVSKAEQLKRFKDRLEDPFKNWKITAEDIRNSKRWNDYVKCSDEMIKRCPKWQVIASDDKKYARLEVMTQVLKKLRPWMKDFNPRKQKTDMKELTKQLAGSSK